MIVIALVGVFVSGFLLGAVLGFRRLEDWFDPWLPDAVTERFDVPWPPWIETGDAQPETGTEALVVAWCKENGVDWIDRDGVSHEETEVVTGDVLPESTTETLR